jgi:hypothetical protein
MSASSASAPAAEPALETPSAQRKRHASERAFLASRLATASKPRLGRPALAPSAAAEQTAALEARIAAEVAALRAARAARGEPEEDAEEAAAPAAAAAAAAAVTASAAPASGDAARARAAASSPAPAAAPAPAPAAIRTRAAENAALATQLAKENFEVFPVAADGHCLFRATAHQLVRARGEAVAAALAAGNERAGACPFSPSPLSLSLSLSQALLRVRSGAGGEPSEHDFRSLRRRAATYIRLHADDFAPFLPYEPSDGYPDSPEADAAAGGAGVRAAVAKYCERLERSALWGGHPELKALCCTLGVPFVVYQAEGEPWRLAPTADRMVGGGGGGGGGSGASYSAPRPPRRRGRAREEYDGGDADDADDGGGGRGATDGGVSDEAALRLSFHRHFAPGVEHYNSVVPTPRAARA